ncbi:MAG: hypothetical protein QNJ00_01510 [Woeseiaceae bacterium]|nr:hypothetical protein [Woeseiaceae bacterium]
MNKVRLYMKIVEWSDEDQCFIGRVPGLALGGVHGKSERRVFDRLCKLVDEWVNIHEADGAPLVPPSAERRT